MEIQEIKSYKKPDNEDYIEAEIVDDGKNSARSGNHARKNRQNGARSNPEKAFSLIKYKIMGLILVVGIIFTLFGFVLTSTIIGAIIGIPFMLLGISLLSLFGKLLFSKNKPMAH
ncbi:MAG: hypothetical protein L6420_00280 [Elusimicrobia bacterium]|nr:hypothetical protein [Elusimicrobiota bacterium]